jgi:hypothetical protein
VIKVVGTDSDEQKNPTSKKKKKSATTTKKQQQQQSQFHIGDKVQFNISTSLRTSNQTAVNVKLIEPRRETGYITMIKDNYGFIELIRKFLEYLILY